MPSQQTPSCPAASVKRLETLAAMPAMPSIPSIADTDFGPRPAQPTSKHQPFLPKLWLNRMLPWTNWVPIRKLGKRHRSRVLKHLLALDATDRHLRFGYAVSDEQIGLYVAAIDFERDNIFAVFGRSLRIVALAHLAFAEPARQGEFGVSVLASTRGRGLGSRLFEHCALQARNHGATSLVIYLARHNAAMLAIVEHAGATLSFDGSDAVAHLPLTPATWATQIEALIEEQAAELDFQLKLHVQRLGPFRLHA
jgi:ribosomal protein S18 acetylase RimI-like enzyme